MPSDLKNVRVEAPEAGFRSARVWLAGEEISHHLHGLSISGDVKDLTRVTFDFRWTDVEYDIMTNRLLAVLGGVEYEFLPFEEMEELRREAHIR